MVRRFDVYLVGLDPVMGSEIAKTRPCVIVSPDSMNAALRTVIVAPLSSANKRWPSRVPSSLNGHQGEVVLDQLRAIDKSRLLTNLGALDVGTAEAVSATLVEMFLYE